MIERLGMKTEYNAMEASIHLSRYLLTKDIIFGKHVLDAACGEGYGAYLIKEWGAESVLGIDSDEGTIENAKSLFQAPNLDFRVGNVENISFLDDNSYDVIVSFETIEHIDNPKKFLNEIKRIVKTDGIVIISCPNDHYYYPSGAISNPYHKRKYTYDEFCKLTQDVLGQPASRCMSGALIGFVNCIHHETDAKISTIYEVLKSIIAIPNTHRIPSNTLLNTKNACYWASLWDLGNSGKMFEENMVSFVTDLKSAGQPLQDSVFFENKLWESFEQQGMLGEIISKQQVEASKLQERLLDAISVNAAFYNEVEFLKKINDENKTKLNDTIIANKMLSEKLNKLEPAYNALSNEIAFLKENTIKAAFTKKKRRKFSAMLRDRYMAMRSEKVKLFIWRIYSMMPYRIRKLIKKA